MYVHMGNATIVIPKVQLHRKLHKTKQENTSENYSMMLISPLKPTGSRELTKCIQ